MDTNKPKSRPKPRPPDLLPDFCNNQTVLLVMLIAELLAIVLTLNQAGRGVDLFSYLGYASFFIQTITLIDAAILCYGKRWFYRLQPVPMSIVIYLLLQLVTVSVTLLQYRLLPDGLMADMSDALLRNVCISAIITAAVMRYFYLQYQGALRQRAENEARVQALQARIRPHFLFNSLNTIANLVHTQPSLAEDAIVDLAELFRSTLADRVHISLTEELEVSRRYLSMELLRLGPRLQVKWNIPAEFESLQLPGLILQPLIENAIYHGIEPLPEGGVMTITAKALDNRIQISVSNPVSSGYRSRHSSGNQLAVANIRQRLALAYGVDASLFIDESDSHYTVILTLPDNRTS